MRYISYTAESAPVNTPDEFLAFCGVLGLGRLLNTRNQQIIRLLRQLASDSRWRIREAVAMALQSLGDTDMDGLLEEMSVWANGMPLGQRAAAAAICEPRLLKLTKHATAALQILDAITGTVKFTTDRRDLAFLALRQGLGYCWSVAVAALPDEGKAYMDKWILCSDNDVIWIMKENLKKSRLVCSNEVGFTVSSSVREVVAFDPTMTGVCESIFAALPDWFGMPSANAEFIANLTRLPAFVVKSDGRVVGFIAVESHFPESAEIHVLALHPDYHRQGIGRILLGHTEKWLADRGVKILHVKTLGPMHPDPFYAKTRAFYIACGFLPVFQTTTIWGPENPTLIMVKQL